MVAVVIIEWYVSNPLGKLCINRYFYPKTIKQLYGIRIFCNFRRHSIVNG
jgi:hypothetical protein